MTMDATLLAEWFPVRVHAREGGFDVEWCHLGGQRFTEPFFDDTIQRRLRYPFNWLFRHQTSLDELAELEALSPGLPPTGLIFHMSRCGSTLLAQTLAALPRNIVLSEPAPVDTVLRARWGEETPTEEQRIAWLRGMVSVLGRKRHATERHLFIKFDAWALLQWPLIQRAFPGVPWLFLYRDPVEVMASHLRHSGAHLVPGVLEPALLGWSPEQLPGMPREEYGARVLASLCEAALGAWESRRGPARLVEYRELPAVIPSLYSELFGLELSGEELAVMREAMGKDAKNPALPFEDDSAMKQRALTGPAREAVERWVRPLYARLETARRDMRRMG
ncbi:aspartyl beta-hydroxylase [Archangium violaceum]|uniref:Aspartyl beta-hydroxylase n=1 Tax=Archangium violaceum Cb vi76 TaxID=1406225 RepID=A0A084T0A3_9BACT|nr:aspartyl beta-hydroxylase [Archangium violaceum]KFA94138.1 aspartyl beta-hydroxylase [Archangium violaceum Cb vi76]